MLGRAGDFLVGTLSIPYSMVSRVNVLTTHKQSQNLKTEEETK